MDELEKDLDILKKKYPEYKFKVTKRWDYKYKSKEQKNIIIERSKKFYRDNYKDKNEKFYCPYCLKYLKRGSRHGHIKSKKHIRAVKANEFLINNS